MPSGLRERKAQRQRDALVEAAVELFRERGYAETRVQDILERAEISLTTFYNYFPGKDAVLDDFAAGVIASYVQLARAELEAAEQPIRERVRTLARACGRAFSSDPQFMAVVVMQARGFWGRRQPPAHGVAREVPIYGVLAQLFEEGQAKREIRDDIPPIELAETFSGVFMFAVVSWLTEWQTSGKPRRDADAELESRLMRAFDVFLEGCAV